MGVSHTWEGVDIDETPVACEPANELALRLASAKAKACRELRPQHALIMGADTVVAIEGEVFGKAASEDEAVHMLSRLSGTTHRVYTAVSLDTLEGELTALSATSVRLRRIEPDEARAYWRTGEPADKAGAYAIQGIGGIFVEALSGSWSGVVGLPVFETAGLLRAAGIDLLCPSFGSRGAI